MVARADALTLFQPYGIGRGVVVPFKIAAPAAGANFTRTTATGYWERVVSLFFLFTSSAAVANRQVALVVQDGDGNVLGGVAAPVVQAASLAGRYYFGLGATSSASAGVIRQSAGLTEMFLQPTWKLVSNVGLIDVADTITLIEGVVEQFGIGPDGTPVGEAQDPYTERGRGFARALESE